MTIENRRKNILETANKFNTLVDLPEDYIERVARGEGSPEFRSNHQASATSIASAKSGYSEKLILEWCAASRPPLFKAPEALDKQYINWKHQHDLSTSELARVWCQNLESDSALVARVYAHVEM